MCGSYCTIRSSHALVHLATLATHPPKRQPCCAFGSSTFCLQQAARPGHRALVSWSLATWQAESELRRA
eukprot:364752-Chlamydomonas_euryale.AAC.6